jgi:tetratricopeptide (TPR) repeat protein
MDPPGSDLAPSIQGPLEQNSIEHAAASDQLRLRLDELEETLKRIAEVNARNDRQIDDLQIVIAEKRAHWSRNGPLLIALMSLLFSLGTTAVTYFHTAQQDYQSSRAELRTLLQRIAALPKENLDALKNTDAGTAYLLSGSINAENILLAKQAQELIDRRLSNQNVTATEYVMLATAFYNSGLLDDSDHELRLAMDAIRDVNDDFAVHNNYGVLQFSAGNLEQGRESFRQALAVGERFPVGAGYILWLNAQTELQWTNAELNQKQCAEASNHFHAASGKIAQLPDFTGKTNLSQQVAGLSPAVEACS